jgi:hypothetical protein
MNEDEDIGDDGYDPYDGDLYEFDAGASIFEVTSSPTAGSPGKKSESSSAHEFQNENERVGGVLLEDRTEDTTLSQSKILRAVRLRLQQVSLDIATFDQDDENDSGSQEELRRLQTEHEELLAKLQALGPGMAGEADKPIVSGK